MAPMLLPDEVLEERQLFGADALEGCGLTAAGGPPGGDRWLRWPAERKEVALPCPIDLEPFDEIALHCDVPVATGLRLYVRLESEGRTPGMAEPDRAWDWAQLGTEAREPRFGPQEARFDLEDFHFYGVPTRWATVRRLVLSRSGNADFLVSSAVVRRRFRPAGPRLTDQGFFSLLDLQRPELQAVARAWRGGSLARAFRALLEHYRARETPRHFYPRPAPAPGREDAERLARNEILGYAFGGAVDWRANPFGYLEWRHAFNRHFFFRQALAAYLASGEERWSAKLDEWVVGWAATSPEPERTNGGGDPAWETLSTACRIYGSWLDVFFGTLRSSAFADSTRMAMLKSIWAHAEHLLHHSVVGGNNWLVVESQALASIGLLFPEFKAAETWRREGFARLAAEIGRQIYPDGADWELSPGYHAMAARGFAEPMELARMNGVELPAGYAERIRGAFNFSLGILRPDFTVPAPNDSGAFDGRQSEWLAYGARLFDDDRLRWGATGGAEGRPPEQPSLHFEDSGYCVMRSSWDSDARWLFFDAGPLGFSHVHEDKLSFELAAHGKLFIVDPGIASYQHDTWTEHYRRTEAHNTILIDGAGQDRGHRLSREEQARSARGSNLWASGRVLDAVCSEYCDGYRGIQGEFVHRRSLLFIRPDYWLLTDEVEGSGEHDLTTLFHFTPMQMALDPDTGRVRSDRLNLPNFEIVPVPAAGSPPAVPQIVCGQRDPVQGWVVSGRGLERESLPAPTVAYEVRAALPWRCAWLLLPFTGRTAAGVSVDTVDVGRGRSLLLCRHPDGRTDRLLFSWGRRGDPGPVLELDGCRTDAWAAVVRAGADGAVTAAAAVGGTCLECPEAGTLRQAGTGMLEWST